MDYCYQQKVQRQSKSLTLQCGERFPPGNRDGCPLLTDSEKETIILSTELNVPLVAEIRSGQSYLKKYDEMVANPPKPTPETTKQATKQPVKKKKELRYAKALPKDKVEGSSTPYHFDVLAQLANISARIILYELLRLSKSIRKTLTEALADAEAFMAQILAEPQEDEENCLHPLNMSPA